MPLYKVEADYAPQRLGLRTEPGTNSIEYYTEDRMLAEEIAESYVLRSDRRNGVEWIETNQTAYELASVGSDSPLRDVHAKIEIIETHTSMPQIWTADQRQEALEQANAE